YPQNTFEPLALSLGRAVGAFSCTLTGSRGSGRLVCSRQEEGLLPPGPLHHEHNAPRLWVETSGPAGAAVVTGAGQMRAMDRPSPPGDAGEMGAAQVRAGEVRAGEVRPGEVRPGEVGARQDCPAQHRAFEVGVGQVRPAQV